MRSVLDEKVDLLFSRLKMLKSSYNINKIGFFGSITRNDFTEKSDIDIVVELGEPIGFFKFMELERYLSDLLGYKVDLVTDQAIKPAVRESIFKDVVYV